MKRVLSLALTIAFAISLCVCTVEAFPLMDESVFCLEKQPFLQFINMDFRQK